MFDEKTKEILNCILCNDRFSRAMGSVMKVCRTCADESKTREWIVTRGAIVVRCQCGAEKAKTTHSDWCPKKEIQ